MGERALPPGGPRIRRPRHRMEIENRTKEARGFESPGFFRRAITMKQLAGPSVFQKAFFFQHALDGDFELFGRLVGAGLDLVADALHQVFSDGR